MLFIPGSGKLLANAGCLGLLLSGVKGLAILDGPSQIGSDGLRSSELLRSAEYEVGDTQPRVVDRSSKQSAATRLD